MPAAMALRAEDSGIKRAALDPFAVFVLSLLGGAFVAFGAIFATTVSAGTVTSFGAGGVVSLTVIVCTQSVEIPQALVAP